MNSKQVETGAEKHTRSAQKRQFRILPPILIALAFLLLDAAFRMRIGAGGVVLITLGMLIVVRRILRQSKFVLSAPEIATLYACHSFGAASVAFMQPIVGIVSFASLNSLAYSTYSRLNEWITPLPVVPEIPMRIAIYTLLSGIVREGLEWFPGTHIDLQPSWIGFGLLSTTDFSFTFWFFYLINRISRVVFATFGTQNEALMFRDGQFFDGLLVMGLFMIWLNRHNTFSLPWEGAVVISNVEVEKM